MTTQDELKEARNHSAWTALDDLLKRLSASTPRSATDRETVTRVQAITQYVRRFRSLNVRLLPSDRLSTLQRIETAASYLSNLIDGWDQSGAMPNSTVSNLDRYSDELLKNVATWPPLNKAERDRVGEKAEEAAQTATSNALKALLADTQSAQEFLTQIRQTAESTSAQSRELTAQAQHALEELQAQLSTTETLAADQRQADQAKVEMEFEGQQAEIAIAAEEQRKELKKEAQALIEKLNIDKATATKLLAFVSDGSVSGGYGKYAKAQLHAYRLWNGLGGVTAIAGISYLIWHFQDITGLDVAVTITRAALSLPIFGFAAFAFNQATLRHRNSEEATYRALDLLALPPFTNDMPEEDRSQLRMIMGQRIFSRLPDKDEKKTAEDGGSISPESVSTLTSLLKTIQGFIK